MSKQIVDGVCCLYCKKFEYADCPVKGASPWSRYKNFCSEYEKNSAIKEAKDLFPVTQKLTSLKDIIVQGLKDNGFDGLCGEVCGCGVDNILPCGGEGGGLTCNPAYKIKCPGMAKCGSSDWCKSESNFGNDCYTTTKQD